MRYLEVCREQYAVTSNDQWIIESNYLTREDFDLSIPFHAALHYVFIKYGATVSYSKVYDLRMGINLFLDFSALHNSRIAESLKIHRITDLGAEEFKLFESFLIRIGRNTQLAANFKSALKRTALLFEDGFPRLELPVVSVPDSVPFEPLSDAADSQFYEAGFAEVDRIREKLKVQQAVKCAVPYDQWEVNEISRDLYALLDGQASDWTIDPVRAAATLDQHGLPSYLGEDMFNWTRADAISNSLSSTGRRPDEFVLSCLTPGGFLRKRAPGCISLSQLNSMIYPTAEDQAALALMVQRQLAWNKETVLALDKDSFLHPLSEVALSGTVIIISEKVRSQSTHLNHVKPKILVANSNREDPYSAFNLIELAISISEKCISHFKNDPSIGVDHNLRRSPFVFLRGADRRTGHSVDYISSKRLQTLDEQGAWNLGVRSFLEKAAISDSGVTLIEGADIQGRLRATATQKTKKAGKHPIAFTALLQGHSNPETTDVHYDSSAYAMADRRERFRSFQESLIARMQEGRFTGLMGSMSVSDLKQARFRIFTILGHERALWACMDSSKPEYPGSSELQPGERCTRLEKCNGCKQVYILGDSLPFLMERLATLELLVERDESLHFQHADEILILRWILDQWQDHGAIKEAQAYRLKHEALLPIDLKSLIAYIED